MNPEKPRGTGGVLGDEHFNRGKQGDSTQAGSRTLFLDEGNCSSDLEEVRLDLAEFAGGYAALVNMTDPTDLFLALCNYIQTHFNYLQPNTMATSHHLVVSIPSIGTNINGGYKVGKEVAYNTAFTSFTSFTYQGMSYSGLGIPASANQRSWNGARSYIWNGTQWVLPDMNAGANIRQGILDLSYCANVSFVCSTTDPVYIRYNGGLHTGSWDYANNPNMPVQNTAPSDNKRNANSGVFMNLRDAYCIEMDRFEVSGRNDVWWYGGKTNALWQNSHEGLRIENSQHCYFRQVRLKRFCKQGMGISGGSTNLIFERCGFDENYFPGVEVRGNAIAPYHVTFMDCTFSYNGTTESDYIYDFNTGQFVHGNVRGGSSCGLDCEVANAHDYTFQSCRFEYNYVFALGLNSVGQTPDPNYTGPPPVPMIPASLRNWHFNQCQFVALPDAVNTPDENFAIRVRNGNRIHFTDCEVYGAVALLLGHSKFNTGVPAADTGGIFMNHCNFYDDYNGAPTSFLNHAQRGKFLFNPEKDFGLGNSVSYEVAYCSFYLKHYKPVNVLQTASNPTWPASEQYYHDNTFYLYKYLVEANNNIDGIWGWVSCGSGGNTQQLRYIAATGYAMWTNNTFVDMGNSFACPTLPKVMYIDVLGTTGTNFNCATGTNVIKKNTGIHVPNAVWGKTGPTGGGNWGAFFNCANGTYNGQNCSCLTSLKF